MSFITTLPHVLKHEGGYANDPVDRGQETFRGISRASNPAWPGWPLIDAAKGQAGPSKDAINRYFENDQRMYDLVAGLYRRAYYDPVARFTTRERPVDKLFDAAVNLGVGGAVKIAQRIVGADADGAIGPLTLAAAAAFLGKPDGEQTFIELFCVGQIQHYLSIAKRNPSQERFLPGWLRRGVWQPAA